MVTDRQIQKYLIDVGFQSAILTLEGMNEIQDMNVRINYYSIFRKDVSMNKIYLFKDEILKNLPEVITNPNELYLYFKSGNIFMNKP